MDLFNYTIPGGCESTMQLFLLTVMLFKKFKIENVHICTIEEPDLNPNPGQIVLTPDASVVKLQCTD